MEEMRNRPQVFLSGSAIGYYGDAGSLDLDEASPPGDDFGAALCKEWEEEATKANQLGIRTCLLRTGLVLGKNGGMLGRMLLPFKLGLGGRIGNGRQYMSWIHLDDYIGIMMMLLQNGDAHGAFNMTAPLPVTNAEFTRTLAFVLHRPAFLVTPAWFLRLLLGEMSSLLLGGQKVLPVKLKQVNYDYKYPVLEYALEQIVLKK
jgi:uncharacterized protein (TIGR01777 family)